MKKKPDPDAHRSGASVNSGDFLDVDFGWRYACAVPDHFWAGAAMQIEQVSEDEQTRRRAFNEDIRVSIALGTLG